MRHGRPSVYTSKRDVWIVVLIWFGALGIAFGGIATLVSVAAIPFKLALSTFFFAAAAFMFWVLYGVSYTLTDDELLVRCGPFRYRVPLADIESVSPSRNPLSSPAASLDRVLIKWQAGRRRILISPEPRRKFLKELAKRCDQLVLAGDTLERHPPVNGSEH